MGVDGTCASSVAGQPCELLELVQVQLQGMPVLQVDRGLELLYAVHFSTKFCATHLHLYFAVADRRIAYALHPADGLHACAG